MKNIWKGLNIQAQVQKFSTSEYIESTTDPTTGMMAPLGSICFHNGVDYYYKVGKNDTDWISLSGGGGGNTLAGLDDTEFTQTFDDWHLPSKDELQELYEQLYLKGIGGYSSVDKWSSSEGHNSTAWKLKFTTGEWHPGYSKTNLYGAIPVREFSSKITYSLRDKGPGGGWIFYKDGDYYLEAYPTESSQRWAIPGEGNIQINTLHEIGSGVQNTLNMIAALTDGAAYWCDNQSYVYNAPIKDDIVVFNGTDWEDIPLGSPGALANLNDVAFRNFYDDWYMGSRDLMEQLMIYVGTGYSGQGYNSEYFTSSEFDADTPYTIRFNPGVIITSRDKSSTYPNVRPVRDFQAAGGTYTVGDTGPAGGEIFYIDGTTHYEVSTQDSTENMWSNVFNTLVGTGTAIGTGLANTQAIVGQIGHTNGHAKYCLDFRKTTAHPPVDGDLIIYNEEIDKWIVSQQGIEVITASNGLSKSLSDIQLGGTLSHHTTVNNGTFAIDFLGTDGVSYNYSLSNSPTGAKVSYSDYNDLNHNAMFVADINGAQMRSNWNSSGDGKQARIFVDPERVEMLYQRNNAAEDISIRLDTDGAIITNERTPDGIRYAIDYSGGYTARSLVDMEYVNNLVHPVDDITLETNWSGPLFPTAGSLELDIEDAFNEVDATNISMFAGVENVDQIDSTSGIIRFEWTTAGLPTGPIEFWSNIQLAGTTSMSRYDGGTYHGFAAPVESAYASGWRYSFDYDGGTPAVRFYVDMRSGGTNPEFVLKLLKRDKPTSVTKIKEIDYIIGNDEESIDGSDTPMSTPDRELVTRGYVDANSQTLTASQGISITASDIRLGGNITSDIYIYGSSGARMAWKDQGRYLIESRTGDSFEFNYYDPGIRLRNNNTYELRLNFDNSNITELRAPVDDARLNNQPTGAEALSIATVGYVDGASHWSKTTTQLTPADSNVDSIIVNNAHNGYNTITLRNTNTGNGAGAVFEVHKSSTMYQDNMYMGIYSDNFWLSQLAGNGVLMTDQNLVIGTVDVNSSIDFLVGNSYTNPVVVGHLNQDGFHLDALQTTAIHPTSYYNLFVNAATGLIYASNTGALGNTPQIDTFTINGTDITNGYLDLSQTPSADNHNSVNWNGSILFEGVSEDYTITSGPDRIVFTAAQILLLTSGDKIQVRYKY